MTVPDAPEQLINAWTRLHKVKENHDVLADAVMNFLYEYVKEMINMWVYCSIVSLFFRKPPFRD